MIEHAHVTYKFYADMVLQFAYFQLVVAETVRGVSTLLGSSTYENIKGSAYREIVEGETLDYRNF